MAKFNAGVINRCQIAAVVNDTGGKFVTGILLVLLIPAANLPPMSTTPVANCYRYQYHRRWICHRCQWHRWQIMETISGCLQLKVNLKKKICLYVNSTTQRCPNKIFKTFLIEDFFHLPLMSTILEVHLELQIYLREFSKKMWNSSNGILRGFGETKSWKKTWSRKSRSTVPLRGGCLMIYIPF